MQLIIAGVARSGTTLVYESLARRLITIYGDALALRYEPYLWNVETPSLANSSFSTDALDTQSIFVHTNTPLFLAGRHPLHDAWLSERLGLADEGRHLLAKVIRGGGRLESYLSFNESVKLLLIVRNPIDTLNSARGRFSLFGSEIHPSDEDRFFSGDGWPLDKDPSSLSLIQRMAAWWSAMTDHARLVAAKHPQRVSLIAYEALLHDPAASARTIAELVDIDLGDNGAVFDLDRPSGPTTSVSNLNGTELAALWPSLEDYAKSVMAPSLGAEMATEFCERTAQKFAGRLLGARDQHLYESRKTGVQLWDALSNGGRPARPYRKRIEAARKHAEERGRDTTISPHFRTSPAKSVGLVVATHNDAATISDSLLSALNQTQPFEEIVVVDDHSRDATPRIIKEYTSNYANVSCITLTSQTGPAFARDIGTRSLRTDWVTQMDADDLLWPTKNASEMAAIADGATVAFSDIMIDRKKGFHVVDTFGYDGGAEQVQVAMLSRAAGIPRDMVIPRSLYLEVGGFDLRLDLFEDWDFKIRLAFATGVTWCRSAAPFGTLYDRRTRGLSDQPPDGLARHVIWILDKNRPLFKGSNREYATLAAKAVASLKPTYSSAFEMLLAEQPWVLGMSGGVFGSRSFLHTPAAKVAPIIEAMNKPRRKPKLRLPRLVSSEQG